MPSNPSASVKPYETLAEIGSRSERSDFRAFYKNSRPTAEQLARFNRPEFAKLLTRTPQGYHRADIKELPQEANGIKEWFGELRVAPGARIEMPALRSVDSDVFVLGKSVFEAPALSSVGRDVSVGTDSTFVAPSLLSVGRDVSVSDNSKLLAPALISVGENVAAFGDTILEIPALTSVGRDVRLWSNSTIKAPSLTSISADVAIFNDATFDAPILADMGGKAYLTDRATFNAPLLGYGVEAKPEPAQHTRPPLPTPVIPTPKVGGTDGHTF